MTAAGRPVDLEELQGNILCGYGNAFGYGLYAFLKVQDAAAGRALLLELLNDLLG
jgi:hypothetical protein